MPLKTRDDLSMAYTPGVARVCLALAEHPEDVRRLTIKGNTVAVVTDGSAVLGLGDIGPGAAMPVMEGKAALFKRFGDIDAWPICLDTQDVDEIVRTVELIAPGFGGINLEDIAAPRCFEIEARLREKLDIPVFHDDQHGTAIVALAALKNALRVVDKHLPDVKIVVAGGARPGRRSCTCCWRRAPVRSLVWDREGILSPDDDRLGPAKRSWRSGPTPACERGELPDALTGADVFIGVSAGNVLAVEDLARMAPQSIVFPMANPTPEVDPVRARELAAIVASGRSDLPNQINNVLAFPGVFRGLLDARATEISDGMLLAAADALAAVVRDDQLNANFIIPSVFDPAVTAAVAAAVAEQARAEPGATVEVATRTPRSERTAPVVPSGARRAPRRRDGAASRDRGTAPDAVGARRATVGTWAGARIARGGGAGRVPPRERRRPCDDAGRPRRRSRRSRRSTRRCPRWPAWRSPERAGTGSSSTSTCPGCTSSSTWRGPAGCTGGTGPAARPAEAGQGPARAARAPATTATASTSPSRAPARGWRSTSSGSRRRCPASPGSDRTRWRSTASSSRALLRSAPASSRARSPTRR